MTAYASRGRFDLIKQNGVKALCLNLERDLQATDKAKF